MKNINGIKSKPKKRVVEDEMVFDDRTIERVEEKYLITPAEKSRLIKSLEKHLVRDEFYKEKVVSIYFDTDSNNLAIRSIDRPNFRFKVRARLYNAPKGKSPVFFEVKSKLAVKKIKIGNKRRLALTQTNFKKFLGGKESLTEIVARAAKGDFGQLQVARELEYLINFYELSPKTLVAVDRTAFSGKNDERFRLTFDENLRFREKNLRFEKGDSGEKYFPNTADPKRSVIMEVKTMYAMPPWFVAELSREKIYPTRFSKYGKIYQLIKERNQQ
ncbi:polyphosphate polymerase domain-containing protein [Candidatus Saccharibacteria bacterium]|nr:polyphosphate polymerase domain-containing protein [Candidatus Saccharibacteria bacterium]